jgi:hypothetical protein
MVWCPFATKLEMADTLEVTDLHTNAPLLYSTAAGIGFTWGGGSLTQAGKNYPLKISGLTVGNVGITKASAYGKVFNLKNLSDINGTYAAIGTTATVGGGGSAIAMKNAKGVVIDVYTTTEGASIGLGTAGFTVELKQ